MNKKLIGLIAGLALFLGASMAQAVSISDKDWRQLTDTVNISYNDLVADSSNGCSASTGECNGSLTVGAETVEFNGWTWATRSEVGALFETLIFGSPTGYFTTSNTVYGEQNSSWAPQAIDVDLNGPDNGYFQLTGSSGTSYDFVLGITRTDRIDTSLIYGGYLEDNYPDETAYDHAYTPLYTKGSAYDYKGVWLYHQVPEPGTLALLGIGLFGMGLARRRQKV